MTWMAGLGATRPYTECNGPRDHQRILHMCRGRKIQIEATSTWQGNNELHESLSYYYQHINSGTSPPIKITSPGIATSNFYTVLSSVCKILG
jgi:hypothetical protein